MEATDTQEPNMTAKTADQLERDADLLDAALLAPSMKSRALREEARALRETEQEAE